MCCARPRVPDVGEEPSRPVANPKGAPVEGRKCCRFRTLGCLAACVSVCVATQAYAQSGDEPAPSEVEAETETEGAPNERPDSSEGENDGDGSAAPNIVPPRVIEGPQPEYPMHRLAEGLHPEVVMLVHIGVDGQVVEVHVEHHADAEFDRLAEESVRTWRFEPARRDGVPVPVRVRVAVHFELPEVGLDTGEPDESGVMTQPDFVGQDEPGRPDHDHAGQAEESRRLQNPGDAQSNDDEGTEHQFGAQASVALEALRESQRAAGDTHVDRDVVQAAPRSEGAEVLRSAPGVYIGRGEGDGIAHNISLRGFNAEHGQDIGLSVDGIPINLPSHIHGQGYADLGFLIPEMVSGLAVSEGVSDPAQGDFSVAGSIDVELGAEPGFQLAASYGSFGTFRALGLWGHAREGEEHASSFAGAQIRRTSGYGEGRQSLSGSAIFRIGLRSGAWRHRVTGIGYGVRAGLAGVIRRDDIDAGRVGFYDRYDFATAEAQDAAAARAMVGWTAERRDRDGGGSSLGLWFGYDRFRLEANFTGFMGRSTVEPDWVGRGDLIQQQNRSLSVGFHGRHRTRAYRLAWLQTRFEVGASGRFDSIQQAQRLVQAPQGTTWDELVDASIGGADLGLYADMTMVVAEVFTFRVGGRADVLFYEVDDAFGNRIPDFRRETFIEGTHRSAAGVVGGPRTSARLQLGEVALLASYGEGYRSPQARTLADGEEAPFTRVRSGDIGLRWERDEVWDLSASVFGSWLGDDVAFEPREGRLERVGASRRLGATLAFTARPWPWLVAAGSVAYVDAELREPPPPSAEDPDPPFQPGQNLPYVPPVTARLDVAAHGPLARLGEHALEGRVGIGASAISQRPLPYGDFSPAVALLDASASLSLGAFTLRVDAFNLLGQEYPAVEYNFTSSWDRTAAPSRLPARHISAGAPRTVMFTLGAQL